MVFRKLFLVLACLWLSAVLLVSASAQASISIISPDNRAIFQQVNGSADIAVSVTATGVPSGGSVLLILDADTAEQSSLKLTSTPYTCTFPAVSLGEHTLDAYVVDSVGVRTPAHDSRSRIGVGEIIVCMGDSITEGEVDDISSDNWSADGRNGPYIDAYSGAQYGGFEPILNDMLTQTRGYPHSVVNVGHYGDQATDGIAKVGGFIAQYPTAKTWLIAYGANDASHGVSASHYKSNVQQIIKTIQTAIPGAEIYLPHMFYKEFSVYSAYHDRLGDLIR
ncbi:MAG TPA: SGNH/GDSL hydrolase family protein, partial [Armatimonadota bacterium]